MGLIYQNYSLDHLNTFHLSARASYFALIRQPAEMEQLAREDLFREQPKLILGGGSNLLLTGNFNGLVIRSGIQGLECVDETDESVWIRVGSGMEWDELVAWAVAHDWGGLENLSAIPGDVGAAPVQNIGAYGAEAKDMIERVEGFDFNSKTWKTFEAGECEFDYRNSIFKKKFKNEFLVSQVTFRLSKAPHSLLTHYGNLEEELQKTGTRSLAEMRRIITDIRRLKLPDIHTTGNAGSFFKNPVVSLVQADQLRDAYPNMPAYPAGDRQVKLSAAWLIDQSGLKGYTMGRAATHTQQPLVLINTGGATGEEIWKLAEYIREFVFDRYGVMLEPEVNVY